MITIRRSEDRGHFDHGWLETRHTFSFADYHDPDFMGFRALRVINEDVVEPGSGFPTHSHRDMEIITVVLEGAIEHKDSMGTGSILRPGEVQRMTAGTGVTHSEYNPSKTEPLHLLQIWILPHRKGLTPSYQQKAFPGREGKRLLASPDGSEGSLGIHQDARLYSVRSSEASHELGRGRHAWLQVARGRARLNGMDLSPGDGAAVSDEPHLSIVAEGDSEVLLFDLA